MKYTLNRIVLLVWQITGYYLRKRWNAMDANGGLMKDIIKLADLLVFQILIIYFF